MLIYNTRDLSFRESAVQLEELSGVLDVCYVIYLADGCRDEYIFLNSSNWIFKISKFYYF